MRGILWLVTWGFGVIRWSRFSCPVVFPGPEDYYHDLYIPSVLTKYKEIDCLALSWLAPNTAKTKRKRRCLVESGVGERRCKNRTKQKINKNILPSRCPALPWTAKTKQWKRGWLELSARAAPDRCCYPCELLPPCVAYVSQDTWHTPLLRVTSHAQSVKKYLLRIFLSCSAGAVQRTRIEQPEKKAQRRRFNCEC